ncbi:MAG: flagellar protein FlaG [Sideroxydans sp.]|nr:flagellar protein FlaG [Sideroxydans sp.]
MLIQNTSGATPAPIRLPSNSGSVGAGAQVTARSEVTSTSGGDVAVQPTAGQLKHEVDKINVALQQTNKSLELSISVDKSTNKQVIKLMDKETGDTLMQYPNEAVLAIARGIDEFQSGLLLQQKA